jgi:hypothetical protein
MDMPPCDAPILTGDHPLSGKAGINARLQTIVKWQVTGRRAHFRERCPQFFSVFEMGIVANKKAGDEIKLNATISGKFFKMHLMTHHGRKREPERTNSVKWDFSLL